MEIITGIERRRRWRDEDKLRIVAEAEAPGAVLAAVARRHEVSRGQLFEWRRQVRRGELAAAPMVPEFMPVRVMAPPAIAAPCADELAAAANGGGRVGVASRTRRLLRHRHGLRLCCRMERVCGLMMRLV